MSEASSRSPQSAGRAPRRRVERPGHVRETPAGGAAKVAFKNAIEHPDRSFHIDLRMMVPAARKKPEGFVDRSLYDHQVHACEVTRSHPLSLRLP